MNQKRVWKDMTPQEKWQYFKDYYLLKTVIAIAVLIGAVILIGDLMTPEPVYAMQVGVYDTSLSDTDKERLARDIQRELGTVDDVSIDDAFTSLNNEDLLRIVSLSEAKKIDLIIAPKEVFTWLAGYGYFHDLRVFCSDAFLQGNEDRILFCNGLAVGEDGLLTEHAEGSGEPYAAGIDASGTLFEPYLHGMKEPVIGVILESEHLPSFEPLARVTEGKD